MFRRLVFWSFLETSKPTPNASTARVATMNPNFGGLKTISLTATSVHPIAVQLPCTAARRARISPPTLAHARMKTYRTNSPYPTETMPRDSSDVATHPPLMAQSLDASLTTADVNRSRDWYRDVLGFVVDREFQRDGTLFAVSMRAGSIRILLTQDNGGRGANRTKGEGFSLQITTPQDIDAIADHAKRSGAELESEPADAWGVRVFRLRDPDGFKLVISSPRT